MIIPSFKMGAFIGEALESVGAQMYPHWEVIVVDDAGPEDGTRTVVEAFAAKHPEHRVDYIRHDTNQGVSVARRTAFEAARGEYIAFLDADDAFLPDKLSRFTAVLQERRECALVHGPVTLQGNPPPGAADPERWFRHGHSEGPYDAQKRGDYLRSNHICNSTVVCRAKLLNIRDFPDDMAFQYEDWLLWLLLSVRGHFYFHDVVSTRYRCHEGSFTSVIYRSKAARMLAHIELLLAFAPVADAAGLGPVVGRNLLASFATMVGKLDQFDRAQAARKFVNKIMMRAAVADKISLWRGALGRAKRRLLLRSNHGA